MISRRPFLLAYASILVVSLSGFSGAGRAETLGNAVEAALNYHPSVEAALANRDAYREERKEKWTGYFPQLGVRAAAGRMFANNSTSRGLNVSRGEGYSWLGEGSVTLTQMFFDGLETPRRIDAAQARKDSANFNIMDIRENLALRTVIAYLDVLRGRESLHRLKEHRNKVNDYLGRITSMVDEGAADESMVVQARDVLAQLEKTVIDIEGQLWATQAQYAEIVGHFPADGLSQPVPRLDYLPEELEEAVAHVLAEHPSLRAALQTEKASAFEVDAEKGTLYPDINGELSYMKKDQDDVIGGESIDAKAVVRLNWNISVAGGDFARLKKTQHRSIESKAQRVELERQLERDIRVAYTDMETAQRQLKVLHDRNKINQDLFKNYEAQFEAGRVNLLQLMQADNAKFNAELSLLNGEYAMIGAQYNTLARLGRLQESLNVVPAKTDDK